MDLSRWFSEQLKSSADGFAWAVEQIPADRRFVTPPTPLGEWNAARHVFHMLYYEQAVALPSMGQWLGKPYPSTVNNFDEDEDAVWGNGHDLEPMLADFREIRAEQIALLPNFDAQTWNETRNTVWGKQTLKWVVTKTFQHTAEHTHDVLRMALFWDMFVRHLQEKGG